MKWYVSIPLFALSFAAAFLLAMQKPNAGSVSIADINAWKTKNAFSCSASSYVPADFLQKDISIRQGIGNINFPITTSSDKAQAFYNQGMAFLYDFEYVQAARSLYVALRHDSAAGMIYWALSSAYDGLDDSTEARNQIAKAFALSARLPEREKLFIQLQYEVQQPAYDSVRVSEQREKISALMDKANAVLPNDAEMWAYTGILRYLGSYKGKSGETRKEKANATIGYFMHAQQVMYNHFGAWHYLIHASESATKFDTALAYGALYIKAAPAIPHAWHMYAHDLMKTGRVAEAIKNFNYAFELEQKMYEEENMPAHYDWHHPHNMELLAYCYQYKGQFEKAEAVFSQLDTLTAFKMEAEGKIRKGHPYFLLQNNRPDEALVLSQKLTGSAGWRNRFQGYLINGMAYVFKNNNTAAKESYKEAVHIIDSMKNDDIQKGERACDVEQDYAYAYAQAGMISMGVGLLENPYDTMLIKQMNGIQATLLKQTGPDPWIDALYFLQMLTQLSLKTGNLALAEASALNMTKHDVNYPGSYWLLAQIKAKQGDIVKANEYLQKANAGFSEGDKAFVEKLKL